MVVRLLSVQKRMRLVGLGSTEQGADRSSTPAEFQSNSTIIKGFIEGFPMHLSSDQGRGAPYCALTAKVVTSEDEREKQIVEDSARLLKLASDLKMEADKTTFDTLSLGISRKADEIQKLARSVKTKIKDGQTIAAKEKQ